MAFVPFDVNAVEDPGKHQHMAIRNE